jgi:hypothetical protein
MCCAFLTDKRVFVKKDYSKSGIISNVNLPRASLITRQKGKIIHLTPQKIWLTQPFGAGNSSYFPILVPSPSPI